MLIRIELGSISISMKEIAEEIFGVEEIRKFSMKNLSLEFRLGAII